MDRSAPLTVTIERTIECPTAVVKANTTWSEFGTLWPRLLDDVWAFLRATPGMRTDGHNVMLYRHNIPEVEVAVEVGVQVTGPFDTAGRVVHRSCPPATRPRPSTRGALLRSEPRTLRSGRGAPSTAAR